MSQEVIAAQLVSNGRLLAQQYQGLIAAHRNEGLPVFLSTHRFDIICVAQCHRDCPMLLHGSTQDVGNLATLNSWTAKEC